MKKLAKNIVAKILWAQVAKLRAKNDIRVVVVAGSIGKTSTKLAIAQLLEEKFRVRYQDGNYNDLVSIPLVFFGRQLPSLFNPLAWVSIFWQNRRDLKQAYPFDLVVLEIGTDGPGQLGLLKGRLQADIGVLTAVTPEHMEFFKDIAAVAEEELTLVDLASEMIINIDLVASEHRSGVQKPTHSYAIRQPADIRITAPKLEAGGSSFEVQNNGAPYFKASHSAFSEPQLYSIAAAVSVGMQLGMEVAEIEAGIARIRPVSGRMQLLSGINNSQIIDDTYNASPASTMAALNTLYRLNSAHKLAILGNMNELGEYSVEAHQQVGSHCDPKQLELVVTLGPDANKHLAPAAEAKGCKVLKFDNPYSAGEHLKGIVQNGSLILVKGSQNRVFAEETVKLLLANPADSTKLVRQSEAWLKQKKESFERVKA